MKLIVEMVMPRFCAECPMCDNVYYGDDVRKSFCIVFDERKEILTEDRPSWCPIKGVLPEQHGDLIDRDALLETCIYYNIDPNKSAVDADNIQDMPVIIAAERKDDGTTAD